MSFDYSAPAELFLAKPMKGRRENTGGSQRPPTPSAMLLRFYAHPEPSARTWR